MLIQRITVGLVTIVAGLSLAVTSANAQGVGNKYAYGNAPFSDPNPGSKKAHQPFAPVDFEVDTQPFAPADISEYGNGPKSREGFFASYERLYWSISKPALAQVGSQAAEGNYYQAESGTSIFQENSYTTGFLNADFAWGNRYDLGYMDSNDKGWLVSILSNLDQNQGQRSTGGNILFNDPFNQLGGFTDVDGDGFDDDRNNNNVFGRSGIDTDIPPDGAPDLPFFPPDLGDQVHFLPRFDTIQITNRASFNGVELMRLCRIPKFHDGSELELMGGVRYLQFKDRFNVLATGGILDQFFENTTLQNDIVGPQIGARWSMRRARWTLSTEGRFMAGFNMQNGTQYAIFASSRINTGTLVTDAPASLSRTAARSSSYNNEFAPAAEFRLNASYYLTSAFAIKIGYTALFVDGVARASNNVNWSIPNLGILKHDTNDNVFANGINFGIEYNR